MKAHLKIFFLNIVVMLVSLLTLFIVIELGFKVLHFFSTPEVGPSPIKGLPYENTPNGWFLRYSKVSGWVFYRHNSLGMRDLERDYEKKSGTKRVLVIGDSVMYGGEVKFDYIFSRQLENLFGYNDIEVLNCGVTSYSLKEYPVYLKEKGIRFSPDIVVLGLCLNDYKTLFSESAVEEKVEKKEARTSRFNLKKIKRLFHSYLIDYLKDAYLSLRDHSIDFKYGEVYEKETWQENRKYFEEIQDIANTHNSKLIVLILPSGQQFGNKEISNIPQKHIEGILDELSISYVNPFFDFEEAVNLGKRIFKNDYLHFSAEGHKICAEKVFAYITAKDLI